MATSSDIVVGCAGFITCAILRYSGGIRETNR